MARSIDLTKIQRIKTATLQMVVEKGFGGASISEIAKAAGVAEGYLYRHYSSKSDLVQDLLYENINSLIDRFEELIQTDFIVSDVFEQLIRSLFQIANTEPDRIKFLYVLMNDYNFSIVDIQRGRIRKLLTRFKEIGQKKGDIGINVDEEDIYLISISYTIQFINLRLKGFFLESQLGEVEIKKILRICVNSIKD